MTLVWQAALAGAVGALSGTLTIAVVLVSASRKLKRARRRR